MESTKGHRFPAGTPLTAPPTSKGTATRRDPSSSNRTALKQPSVQSSREWVNETYKTVLRRTGESEWAEFEQSSGRQVIGYEEESEGPKTLIVFCRERNYRVRFLDKRAEIMKNDKWEWVANGHWKK